MVRWMWDSKELWNQDLVTFLHKMETRLQTWYDGVCWDKDGILM